ncbi:MAG: ribonuclease HII [Clostridiales bacterium]|nr:ribonuclease HII [Clostridiales bacterium]
MAGRTKEEEAARIKGMKDFDLGHKCGAYLAGIDEAGRGPLAGPVYAAAVVLADDVIIEGINDSKKLSERKREELFEVIKEKAIAWNVCAVDEKRIDEINILEATYEAMRGALRGLGIKPDNALVDGNRDPGLDIRCETVVKGDSKSMSIAAASILAKVSRDRFITAVADKYPEYDFAKHKGYGTKAHREALLKYGPCEIHRKTFLKKILAGTEFESEL